MKLPLNNTNGRTMYNAVVCRSMLFGILVLLVLITQKAATTTQTLQQQRVVFPMKQLVTSQQTHRKQVDIDPLTRGLGSHYLDLYIGCNNTQQQRQTGIVDTGSSKIAFPCRTSCTTNECGDGFHLHPPYVPSACHVELNCSECYRGQCSSVLNDAGAGQCVSNEEYLEGSSWSGYEVRDTVRVGSNSINMNVFDTLDDDVVSLAFFCQTELSGLFQTQLADGIIGMGKDTGNLWSQIPNTDNNNDESSIQSFSLCMTLPYTPETHAGVMVLGDSVDTILHNTPMVCAQDIETIYPHYTVGIRDIHYTIPSVDDVELTTSQQKTDEQPQQQPLLTSTNLVGTENYLAILDSGSTATRLHPDLIPHFQLAWDAAVESSNQIAPIDFASTFDTVYTFFPYNELNAILPTFTFQLVGIVDNEELLYNNNTNSKLVGHNTEQIDTQQNHSNDILVSFTPQRYLVPTTTGGDDSNTEYWFGFDFLRLAQGSVLGANFLAGHDVYHDIRNQRIGFAESDCDYYSIDRITDDDDDDNDDGNETNEGLSSSSSGSLSFTSIVVLLVWTAIEVNSYSLHTYISY